MPTIFPNVAAKRLSDTIPTELVWVLAARSSLLGLVAVSEPDGGRKIIGLEQIDHCAPPPFLFSPSGDPAVLSLGTGYEICLHTGSSLVDVGHGRLAHSSGMILFWEERRLLQVRHPSRGAYTTYWYDLELGTLLDPPPTGTMSIGSWDLVLRNPVQSGLSDKVLVTITAQE